MNQRLKGQVALVTGAGSVGPGWGNGRAIAVRFAEEGAQVVGIDCDTQRMQETAELIKAAGGQFIALTCDVTDSAALAATVGLCIERLGRIDILVNNVGGSAKGGPVEMSEEVWDTQIDHNLKSVFLACKHVLPHMIAQKSGAVVNIASASGIRWSGSAQVAYAATKAGGVSLHDAEDLGFMYSRAFADPDGNGFGPFWMDPAAAGN